MGIAKNALDRANKESENVSQQSLQNVGGFSGKDVKNVDRRKTKGSYTPEEQANMPDDDGKKSKTTNKSKTSSFKKPKPTNTNIGFTKRVLVDNINYENLNYDSKYDHKNSTFNYQSIYKNETANKYQNERTIDGGKHVGWFETIHYNVGYQQYYKNDHVNFPYCSSSNSKRKISEIYSPYTNKDSCNITSAPIPIE